MNPKPVILCVDDEEAILRCLVRLLEADYTVLTAGNGEEGLKVLSQNTVDLIITDQRMPVMDGSWFLRAVKKQYPGIMSIMLSGYSDFDALVRALNEGEVFQFLTKPWDNDVLKDLIARAIEQRRMVSVIKHVAEEARAVLKLASNVKVDYNEESNGVVLHVGEDGVVFSDETIYKFLQFIFNALGVNKEADLKMISGVVVRQKGVIAVTLDMGKGMALKIEVPHNA